MVFLQFYLKPVRVKKTGSGNKNHFSTGLVKENWFENENWFGTKPNIVQDKTGF